MYELPRLEQNSEHCSGRRHRDSGLDRLSIARTCRIAGHIGGRRRAIRLNRIIIAGGSCGRSEKRKYSVMSCVAIEYTRGCKRTLYFPSCPLCSEAGTWSDTKITSKSHRPVRNASSADLLDPASRAKPDQVGRQGSAYLLENALNLSFRLIGKSSSSCQSPGKLATGEPPTMIRPRRRERFLDQGCFFPTIPSAVRIRVSGRAP